MASTVDYGAAQTYSRSWILDCDEYCRGFTKGNNDTSKLYASNCVSLSNTTFLGQELDAIVASLNQVQHQGVRGLFLGVLSTLLPATDARRREFSESCCRWQCWTLVRLTLMPALVHNPSRDLLLQVLRDTLQEYSVPLNLTSKAKWLEDQELELAIRRDEAKTQAQFQAQMGMNAPPPVPDEVDLLTRQDCWDDLIALVVTLCYEGCVFFDLEEGGIVGVGPWMRELEVLQADDDDLRASYYQLLAGMALSSPSLIHQVLSDNSTSTKGKGPTWTSLLENLRWLVHELDGQGRGSTTTATSSTTNSAPSMQYYYQGTSSLEKQQKKSKTKRSGNGSNEDVLSSENWYFLDAILNCLHNTGLASPEARHTILSSKIAASSQGFDSALMILFKLSTLGIPSRVRGRVFNTIGALIQPDDETMYQKALEAWDMIDRIGIVPIALLERSGRGRGRTYGMDNINPKGGMGFPPRLPGPAAETWVADDPAYGILYEMEWLEAPHGVYPSTRGFLNLLTSLVRTAGSTGRSAYLEYVCHMVLPRLTGRIYGPKLPFEGPQEECRLAMAALEVVQTTLAMYPVPGLSFDQLRKVAGKSLLHPRVAELSVKKPVLSDVEHAKAHDGTAAHRSAGINGTTALASNSDSVATNLPMPSPGFLLMVQVLTSGELLQSLLSVLTKWTDAEECANLSKDLALARGLFGSTPPDYAVFYFADQRKVAVDLTELLVNLESMDYGVEPGSTSVWQMALSCLCAIVAREDVIIKIVKDNSLITGLVPQLQWKEGSSPTSFVGHEASLASCGRILWNTNFQHGVLSRLLQWIQSHEDWELTATALTVLLYMDSTVVGVSSAIPVESQALARFLLRRRPIVTDNETAKHVLLDYLLTKARGTTSDAISATTIMNDECLQALLALAKDLTNLDAELGTKCHELLHRTTSPRLELFWVNQLPALVSCCDSTAVVHSVAWCLKSIKQTRVQPEVLRHLLSVIPLDRWPKLSPTTDISPDLARKAKIAMKGPTEVTAGYFLIDPGKVGDDQEDWCVDWNTYVTRDCAAAHVSEALNTLAQNTQHNDHFLLDVLGSLTKSTVLDETHYTAATYNLAHVVLTLVSKAGIDILPDAHQCRNLLARSIVSSGFHTQVQPNAGRRNERTAILAGSLGLLLEGHVEPDENFVPAGRTLLQIVMNGDGHIAAWARSCLTQILCQEQNEEATDVKESMVGQVLHGLAEDLVLRLDNTNAVKLLQDITSMSWGPQTLEQAGILDKLLIFARQFSHESIPLEDHLLLLGGLVPSLASVVKVQEILEAYETSFTHLVQTFPQDGDCLEVFMLLLRSSAMPEEFARRTEATQFAVYLAENPLPQEFLMTLPPFLERDDVDARPSWWESIGLDSASGISNQVASFAVRGVKLASCGIASQEGSTETRGLCRALVQTTYCFRVSMELKSRPSLGMNF